MRRRPLVLTISVLAIAAMALVTFSGLGGGSTTPAPSPTETTSSTPKDGSVLSPTEMMDLLTGVHTSAALTKLGDAVETAKVYRWDTTDVLNETGRWGFILISNTDKGLDSCLIDFQRKGSVRQTLDNSDGSLTIQVYKNTDCSGKGYSSVLLTTNKDKTTVATNADGKATTEPYLAIVQKYTNTAK